MDSQYQEKYKPKSKWVIQAEINKKARDMTKKCVEHNCPYLRRFEGGYSKYNENLYYCAYLLVTHHSRLKEDKDINNCEHWKEEVIAKDTPKTIPF